MSSLHLALTCLLALFALSHAAIIPAGSLQSRTGQRYAIMSEFGMSGSHNVRWNTVPMRNVDAQGNPVDMSKMKGMTPGGCIDIQGRTHPESEEYDRPNGRFKYRCVNGQEEVVACVGSERSNKARIEVGQTQEVNGFWHKCERFENGSAQYTQETSCTTGSGKTYRVGEEVQVGFMRMQCQEHGYKTVGCFYLDDQGKPAPLNAGETRQVGQATHVCEDKNGVIQYFTKSTGCVRNGTEYKEGDTFSLNHIRYKCQDGAIDITGCYIDEQRDLGLGADVVEKNMVYRCYRNGPKVQYNEYACGYNGTPSCKPEPIPQTPDDAPALGRGLKTPGFGTFVAASSSGANNVKLDLDKMMGQKSDSQ
jgi:hypothetical protein